MGWVLFSFHLQRSYSLVVFNEVRECTWLGVPSSIMRKFIYKSGRTQSAQGRETCP